MFGRFIITSLRFVKPLVRCNRPGLASWLLDVVVVVLVVVVVFSSSSMFIETFSSTTVRLFDGALERGRTAGASGTTIILSLIHI